ncbi:MAG: hypothetical protein Q9195_000008 [Heterodermia aff. obscurata]
MADSGFPFPANVGLATQLQSIVRLNGGIPATIGILNGRAKIGFEKDELVELASSAGKPETKKVSTRDLSYICGLGSCGKKLNGGTTVAGTMVLANSAGISIFATGGLGGVHREGETSMDISADLIELGRTPVTVVSSGCKSFLDIPRTLEFLETQGVTVATFADGREGDVDLPAFWTRDSGVPSPMVVQNEEEAAAVLHAKKRLGVKPSVFFANPIPPEYSIDKNRIDKIIAEAVYDARKNGITGHANTPFILGRIRELTGGDSIPANTALIKANVARGTRLAVEYQKIMRDEHRDKLRKAFQSDDSTLHALYSDSLPLSMSRESFPSSESSQLVSSTEVISAGSLAIDLACDYKPESPLPAIQAPELATSNPAVIKQSIGGVGQNIARAIHYLGTSVRLCCAVGEDAAGFAALEMLNQSGMQVAGVQQIGGGARTGQYVAINDAKKDLMLGMADMKIQELVSEEFEKLWKPQLELVRPQWLVIDSTWSPQAIRKWMTTGKSLGAKVAFEPVSTAKCKRLFQPLAQTLGEFAAVPNNLVSLATPNTIEIASMHSAASKADLFEREDWWQIIDAIGLSSSGSRDKLVSMTNATLVDEGVPQQSIQLLPYIPTLLTKLGSQGVLMIQLLAKGDARLKSRDSAPYVLGRSTNGNDIVGGVYMRLFPPAEVVAEDDVVSVNGVGDTFLGIILAGLTKDESRDWPHLIDVAQRGSVMTLKSNESVSPDISGLSSLL